MRPGLVAIACFLLLVGCEHSQAIEVSDPGAGVAPEVATAAEPDAEESQPAIDRPTQAEAVSPGLIAWYRFEEEAGPVRDDSGLGHHGVAEGTGFRRVTPGKVGRAITFAGTDGRVRVPAAETLEFQEVATLEVWVLLSPGAPGPMGVGSLISFGTGNSDDNVLLGTSCGNLQAIFSRRQGGTTNVTSACNRLSPQQWVHVAVVNDTQEERLYLDGVLEKTSPGGFVGPTGADLFFGRRAQGVFALNASLDEVKLWDSVRSPEQICGDAGGEVVEGRCALGSPYPSEPDR